MHADVPRILVAEDHRPTREALRTLLEVKAFSVDAVSNGDAACEALRAPDAPRVALVDWVLPGASGLEVCRAVRKAGLQPYVYLIIITARDGREDIAEAMTAGADDFIHKPCGVSELLARVRNGLRMIRLQDELSARLAEVEASALRLRRLERMLPICPRCQVPRDRKAVDRAVDQFLQEYPREPHLPSVCPDCLQGTAATAGAARGRR